MMENIDRFINRVEASTKARSKELRLTLVEAQQLAFEISKLLSNETKHLQKIVNLQEGKTVDGADPYKDLKIQASVDGGSFKS